MKLTPLSEVVDEVWGKEGTPKRDAMESRLKAELEKLLCGKSCVDTEGQKDNKSNR